MIITTWIVYIFTRKSVGLPFPPKANSTEEEASQNIKEKMSSNIPPTHGHDIHVTRDLVKHQLSKSDMLADPNQEVLEERTRIQFIRWSHTRIFQVPSEMIEDVMQDRIDQVRQSISHLRCDSYDDPSFKVSCSEC
ncbi:spermatogenesis-associated protein 19, mitochondrial isoform X2 [Microtus ochrogaster]|uniref:Spermatogenesis-associated protein 19, mitochondrial isoform X2 n=1 Tax=Microtus ochrogaster TaxID=79684 RepID=A0ABM1AGX8_MICOH|nr:spermatogenesis-associated protein 19, mitochondrial isoform X2 [Microtus ochrogaster]